MSSLIYSAHFAPAYYSALDCYFLPFLLEVLCKVIIQEQAERWFVIGHIRCWGQCMLVFMHPKASFLVNVGIRVSSKSLQIPQDKLIQRQPSL